MTRLHTPPLCSLPPATSLMVSPESVCVCVCVCVRGGYNRGYCSMVCVPLGTISVASKKCA